MYCEKCKRIIQEERCPFCKRSTVREPEANDLCLLTERDYISSGILEDVLQQRGIPFLRKGVMGAGLAIKVGPMLDRSRFYVSFDQLETAMAVTDELFAASEESEEKEKDSGAGCGDEAESE
jgi:hypothetical protein